MSCNERIHSKEEGFDVRFVYASGNGSSIYHLVPTNKMETLCGLRVSRLRLQEALRLVTEMSPRVICKHCERISNVESAVDEVNW